MILLSVEVFLLFTRSMDLTVGTELNFCLNYTCEDAHRTTVTVLLYAGVTAVIILTVCGNLLVIISISHFKQLHTPTNFLILSLATADMMVGVTVMPLQFITKTLCWHMSTTLCYFSLLCSFHFTFVSIYNVMLISLDRFFALSNPFQYSNNITLKVTSVLICLNWFLSLCYNLFFIYLNVTGNGDVVCFGECPVVVNETWTVTDLFVTFVIPCSVMIILYTKIFAIARKHAKNINITRNYGECVPKASERKAATTLGILVIVFVACLLPYFLCIELIPIIPYTLFDQVLDATLTILQLNSAINSIIYALFYPWFQRCAKLILMLKIFNPGSSLINVLSKNV